MQNLNAVRVVFTHNLKQALPFCLSITLYLCRGKQRGGSLLKVLYISSSVIHEADYEITANAVMCIGRETYKAMELGARGKGGGGK